MNFQDTIHTTYGILADLGLIRDRSHPAYRMGSDRVYNRDAYLTEFTRSNPELAILVAREIRNNSEFYAEYIDVPVSIVNLYASIIERHYELI